MSQLYIGLMSGTSLDGIDVAIVDFAPKTPKLVATHMYKLHQELINNIASLRQPGFNEILRTGELDVILGHEFANAVNTLLSQQAITADKIIAIGSHGQTIQWLTIVAIKQTMCAISSKEAPRRLDIGPRKFIK